MVLTQDLTVPKLIQAPDYFTQGSGIVTLCGSTRFFFEFQECNRLLTEKNWIVLSCGYWGHSIHKYTEALPNKNIHYHKIRMSHVIVVVSDEMGYYGVSTEREIELAKQLNIPVFFYKGEIFSGETVKQPPNLYSSPLERF